MDLVSVIVPVYKVEETLRRCVDSIMAQTHSNLEVILIDGGSPDACGLMCDDYASRDSRVVVIHQENSGLSAARNAGIEASSGDFITFVDSDDWISCDFVEQLLCLLEGANANVSMCGFVESHASELHASLGGRDAPGVPVSRTTKYSNKEAMEHWLGPNYVNWVVSWGKLYRKELFTEVRFPAGRFHEDEFTTHRLLYGADEIIYSTRQLYYYWQREASITSSPTPRSRRDRRDAFRERARFLLSVGLSAPANETYRRALWLTVAERRLALSTDDPELARSVGVEMRLLAREIWGSASDWDLRLRALLNAVWPSFVDWISVRRGVGLPRLTRVGSNL